MKLLENVRNLKDRFLSIPWVYDRIRPLAIGGLDYGEIARFCGVSDADRVFELGCGTGSLLQFLKCRKYLGADTDSAALQRARRFSSPSIRFLEGNSWDQACEELNPTVILMIGLVHHLSDEDFQSVVSRIRRAVRGPLRIVSFESTFLPRHVISNLLSALDRGRYVRTPEAYAALFQKNGLRVIRKQIIPTRLRHARYIGFHLHSGAAGTD
jgi:SAM-dependent methyltransferase